MWLFVGGSPTNNSLFVGGYPMNNSLFVGDPPMNNSLFVGGLPMTHFLSIGGHQRSNGYSLPYRMENMTVLFGKVFLSLPVMSSVVFVLYSGLVWEWGSVCLCVGLFVSLPWFV